MIQKMIEQVREFQKAFNLTKNDIPTEISQEEVKLRYDLFIEEYEEYLEGYEAEKKGLEYFTTKKVEYVNTFVYKVDAIIDMLYIACGTIVTHGWKFNHYNPLIENYSDNITQKRIYEIINCYLNSINKYDYRFSYIDRLIDMILNLASINNVYYKLPELFNEVHASNMSKLDDNNQPIINTIDSEYYDPNKPIGKVLKSKNFFEPKLKEILFPK